MLCIILLDVTLKNTCPQLHDLKKKKRKEILQHSTVIHKSKDKYPIFFTYTLHFWESALIY